MAHNSIVILGIKFCSGTSHEVVAAGLKEGLVVIPSAPVLVRMTQDAAHRDALLHADMAVTDSGFMVLLWKYQTGERLIRVSGLEYLRILLMQLATAPQVHSKNQSGCKSGPAKSTAEGGVAWIMPSAEARDRNLAWLTANGHQMTIDDCYLAPVYPPGGALSDHVLLEWVKARKPRHIIIALGGGVQERLGWYLRQNAEFPLSIHCVGAAIGFLSGDQVNIPSWADRHFLGWFFRCLAHPTRFVPRYLKAMCLIPLLWRYGKVAPSVPATLRSVD